MKVNSAVRTAAAPLQREEIDVSRLGDSAYRDLIGGWTCENHDPAGPLVWEDGLILRAAKEGKRILLTGLESAPRLLQEQVEFLTFKLADTGNLGTPELGYSIRPHASFDLQVDKENVRVEEPQGLFWHRSSHDLDGE